MKSKLSFGNTYLIAFLIFPALTACKKGWLDAKPNQNLVVPTTVANFQALLDNSSIMNSNQPTLGAVSGDDFFLVQTDYNNITKVEQDAYTWQVDVFESVTSIPDWDVPYHMILLSNLSLEGLAKLSPDSSSIDAYNNVKGSALFYRSLSFFNLLQLFSLPFDSTTSSSDLGIPLKLASDPAQKVPRSTVQQCYQQILSDLTEAAALLPANPMNGNYNRPGKVAAYGVLARVYLSLLAYPQALLYSDSSLQIQNTLLNYNTLSPYGFPVFPYPGNPEIAYDYEMTPYNGVTYDNNIDTTLLATFDPNDLRVPLFLFPYGNYQTFYNPYYPYGALFGGIAVDEMLLTRAECYARGGNLTAANNDLNTLLTNRYVTNTYTFLAFTNGDSAINRIILERRKELMFRGTRWLDLRRLNKETSRTFTMTRVINGQTYTLPPNDPRYAFPIPQDEIQYNPVTQNNR
jgi:hypothetical protein